MLHYTVWIKDGALFIKCALPLIEAGKRHGGIIIVDTAVMQHLQNHSNSNGVLYSEYLKNVGITLELEDELFDRIAADNKVVTSITPDCTLTDAQHRFHEIHRRYSWLVNTGMIPAMRADFLKVLATLDPKYDDSFIMIYSDSDVAFSHDYPMGELSLPMGWRMAAVAQSRNRAHGILSFQSIARTINLVTAQTEELHQNCDAITPYLNSDLMIFRCHSPVAQSYIRESYNVINQISKAFFLEINADVAGLLKCDNKTMQNVIANLKYAAAQNLRIDDNVKSHLLDDSDKIAKRLTDHLCFICGLGNFSTLIQSVFSKNHNAVINRSEVHAYRIGHLQIESTKEEIATGLSDIVVGPIDVGVVSRQSTRLWNAHASCHCSDNIINSDDEEENQSATHDSNIKAHTSRDIVNF